MSGETLSGGSSPPGGDPTPQAEDLFGDLNWVETPVVPVPPIEPAMPGAEHYRPLDVPLPEPDGPPPTPGILNEEIAAPEPAEAHVTPEPIQVIPGNVRVERGDKTIEDDWHEVAGQDPDSDVVVVVKNHPDKPGTVLKRQVPRSHHDARQAQRAIDEAAEHLDAALGPEPSPDNGAEEPTHAAREPVAEAEPEQEAADEAEEPPESAEEEAEPEAENAEQPEDEGGNLPVPREPHGVGTFDDVEVVPDEDVEIVDDEETGDDATTGLPPGGGRRGGGRGRRRGGSPEEDIPDWDGRVEPGSKGRVLVGNMDEDHEDVIRWNEDRARHASKAGPRPVAGPRTRDLAAEIRNWEAAVKRLAKKAGPRPTILQGNWVIAQTRDSRSRPGEKILNVIKLKPGTEEPDIDPETGKPFIMRDLPEHVWREWQTGSKATRETPRPARPRPERRPAGGDTGRERDTESERSFWRRVRRLPWDKAKEIYKNEHNTKRYLVLKWLGASVLMGSQAVALAAGAGVYLTRRTRNKIRARQGIKEYDRQKAARIAAKTEKFENYMASDQRRKFEDEHLAG